jgi:NTP pyrophosphatase (non-canonical NTP hydrolase)
MKANDYQKLAARTIDKKLCVIDMEAHALHGIVSEAGELHGIYQKAYQGHGTRIETEEHRKKECGDLLWFIAEYCTANGWELEEIMQMNIDKLKARFPEGFSEEKSLHRQEGDI